MTTVSFDIRIPQGSDVDVPIRLTDAEGKAIDLTGASVDMQVREFRDADEVLDELRSGTDRVTIDALAGKITLHFPHDVTEQMPASALFYDIELISSEGRVQRILEGRLRVSREVTRVKDRK